MSFLKGYDINKIPADIGDAARCYTEELGLNVVPFNMRNPERKISLWEWGDPNHRPPLDQLIDLAKFGGGLAWVLPPGVIAIDLDVKKKDLQLSRYDNSYYQGMHNFLEIMEEGSIEDSRTVTVETATGGQHLYYVYSGKPESSWVTSGYLANGIDTRAVGGITLLPPSFGNNLTGRYTFLDVTSRAKRLPPQLSHRMAQRARARDKFSPDMSIATPIIVTDKTTPFGLAVLNYCCAAIRQAPSGQRNNFIFTNSSYISKLVHAGQIMETDALAALESAGRDRSFSSGKSGGDVAYSIKSAFDSNNYAMEAKYVSWWENKVGKKATKAEDLSTT